MNKNAKIVLGILILVVIVGGAIIILMPDKSSAPGNSSTSSTNNSTNSSDTNKKTAAATITYNGKSYTLSADTIKAGQAIKVVNDSSSELDFDSDPHPVHTDNPELNLGDIAPGQSKIATLSTKGHWGFHNHLNPSQHGTITVE